MPHTLNALRRATPESTGLRSKDIFDFIEAIEHDELELHSFMLMKNHSVVAEGWWEPYQRDDIHLLYSLSKSFTSTAIGFAIAAGLVELDDPVISFFPSQLPENPSAYLLAMKVRHLLTMSTGHDADNMIDMYGREDGDWARGFLARDVVYEPGTHFLYNSGASYMLSAIISRVTGMSALEYLRPRLLDPLGIDKATWTECPKGISVGASELSVTTDAIARFGLFYLDKGVWNGQRLLSESWIENATRFHVPNSKGGQSDWEQGYGFQFWRCRHNCFRGDGAFGQFCIVIPEYDMVVAITASVSNMQGVMDLVWQHLLGQAKSSSIAEDAEGQAALKAKLESLKLPPPVGLTHSQLADRVSGRLFSRSAGEGSIQSCTYDFDPEGCTLTIRDENGDSSLRVGSSEWAHGGWSRSGDGPKKSAAIGRWTAEDTYEIKTRYTESPSGVTTVSQFSGDTVKKITTLTARFGSPEPTEFVGKNA